ncbi:MAG: right-handed parallel beta-helix repeat-containing protein [Myxococcota bacterium]
MGGPSGDDSFDGLAPQSALGTLAFGVARLQSGDKLVLLDGTYVEQFLVNVSGEPGAPILIEAQNDGAAIIDGEGLRAPCRIDGPQSPRIHDIVVRGLRCQNSSAEAFLVADAENVTLQRITVFTPEPGSNGMWVLRSKNVLVEDSAVSADVRLLFSAFLSQNVTFRRCWGQRTGTSGNGYVVFGIDQSDNTALINCVGTMTPGSGGVNGVVILDSSNALVLGNIMLGLNGYGYITSSATGINYQGTVMRHNVSANPLHEGGGSGSLFQRADANLVVQNCTLVHADSSAININPIGVSNPAPDFALNLDISNSVILEANKGFTSATDPQIGSIVHRFNNLFAVTTPYTNLTADPTEFSTDPLFDTNRYGPGAYLIRPANLSTLGESGGAVGAEVLYQYDTTGNLTQLPLWPWPMDERILLETGISVTHAGSGGLWNTLDGVYP